MTPQPGKTVAGVAKELGISWKTVSGWVHHQLFHSDQGSQYASYDFRAELANYHITQSMNRTGNCHDNAPTESFFATVKTKGFTPTPTKPPSKPKQLSFLTSKAFTTVPVGMLLPLGIYPLWTLSS